MKLVFSLFLVLIFKCAISQDSYMGLGFGAVYAQYHQPTFDKLKPVLSDSLYLTSSYKQKVKVPGLAFNAFLGVEKSSQISMNFQFMLAAETLSDTAARRFNLAEYSTNINVVGGLYLAKWLRIDMGIGVNYMRVKIKDIGGFYGFERQVKDDYINLYFSPCIEFASIKAGGGISISPFYNLGVTRFKFLDVFGFENTKTRLNTLGVDVKFLLRG